MRGLRRDRGFWGRLYRRYPAFSVCALKGSRGRGGQGVIGSRRDSGWEVDEWGLTIVWHSRLNSIMFGVRMILGTPFQPWTTSGSFCQVSAGIQSARSPVYYAVCTDVSHDETSERRPYNLQSGSRAEDDDRRWSRLGGSTRSRTRIGRKAQRSHGA